MKAFSVYCIAYFILLAIVSWLLYTYPKEELHLMMNSYHMAIEDTFFKYYSTLAEWPLYILALLPVLWRKFQMTLLFAASELTGGAILQILKHLFSFSRPASVFEHNGQVLLPLVQGVDMHHGNSFPSGHASTFFVFFTCCGLLLAYHYRRKNNQLTISKRWLIRLTMLALAVMAALGAYSRVYLSQHFMLDVYAGSIIGFVTPCLIFFFAWKKICQVSENLELKLRDKYK